MLLLFVVVFIVKLYEDLHVDVETSFSRNSIVIATIYRSYTLFGVVGSPPPQPLAIVITMIIMDITSALSRMRPSRLQKQNKTKKHSGLTGGGGDGGTTY